MKKKVENCCSVPQALVHIFLTSFPLWCTDFAWDRWDKACVFLGSQKLGSKHGWESKCGLWEAWAPGFSPILTTKETWFPLHTLSLRVASCKDICKPSASCGQMCHGVSFHRKLVMKLFKKISPCFSWKSFPSHCRLCTILPSMSYFLLQELFNRMGIVEWGHIEVIKYTAGCHKYVFAWNWYSILRFLVWNNNVHKYIHGEL